MTEAAAVPTPVLTRLQTRSGDRIYTLTLRAFQHLPVNVFLIVVGPPEQPEYTALVDTGSDFDFCTAGLRAGVEQLHHEYGEAWHWNTLSRIVITHPHPDHVGGLPFVRQQTRAPVAAHVRAVPVIERPEDQQRRSAAIAESVIQALGVPEGIPADQTSYADRLRRRGQNRMLPRGVTVETPLEDGDLLDGRFRVVYTPGHEGGQICLHWNEVLLSADHLLPRNSPPLQPQWIMPGHGLGHYLRSLDKIERLSGVDLALGGHDEPMRDWRGRVNFLRERYADKARSLLAAASEPRTVYELTLLLHPRLRPLQALLLLDQTAALAEYLTDQGALSEMLSSSGERLYQSV